jgi:hypothetical protein
VSGPGALALAVAACVALATPGVASAQTPAPLSPPDGQVFSWEEVEASGVRLVVQAQPGLFGVQARVSRDAGFVSYADSLTLYEQSPGRYEGTTLEFIFEPEEDAGVYYWQAHYDEFGPVRSFSVKPPYRRPRLRLALRLRPFVGKSYPVFLLYRAGSEPQADRLHLLTSRDGRCPPGASSRQKCATRGWGSSACAGTSRRTASSRRGRPAGSRWCGVPFRRGGCCAGGCRPEGSARYGSG